MLIAEPNRDKEMKTNWHSRQMLHMYQQSAVNRLNWLAAKKKSVSTDGGPTETGVMPHNVTFKIFPSKKLLQPLLRHHCLNCQRAS